VTDEIHCRREGSVLGRLSALGVLITVAAAGGAFASTYVVDIGGTGDYTEIQPALTAAATGDTVLVMPGTYTGENNTILNFGGEDIVLRAAGRARSVTIDCQGSRYAFWFANGESPAATVEGITVTNGYESSGGAVHCSESSPTFIDCTFSNCLAEYGGAIYISTASPSFTNCTFSGNYTEGPRQGGVISCESSSSVFTNCTFTDNSARYGGVLNCVLEPAPTFIGCTFSVNTAFAPAGGAGAV
jgi:predicted outer membrane repeat protein